MRKPSLISVIDRNKRLIDDFDSLILDFECPKRSRGNVVSHSKHAALLPNTVRFEETHDDSGSLCALYDRRLNTFNLKIDDERGSEGIANETRDRFEYHQNQAVRLAKNRHSFDRRSPVPHPPYGTKGLRYTKLKKWLASERPLQFDPLEEKNSHSNANHRLTNSSPPSVILDYDTSHSSMQTKRCPSPITNPFSLSWAKNSRYLMANNKVNGEPLLLSHSSSIDSISSISSKLCSPSDHSPRGEVHVTLNDSSLLTHAKEASSQSGRKYMPLRWTFVATSYNAVWEAWTSVAAVFGNITWLFASIWEHSVEAVVAANRSLFCILERNKNLTLEKSSSTQGCAITELSDNSNTLCPSMKSCENDSIVRESVKSTGNSRQSLWNKLRVAFVAISTKLFWELFHFFWNAAAGILIDRTKYPMKLCEMGLKLIVSAYSESMLFLFVISSTVLRRCSHSNGSKGAEVWEEVSHAEVDTSQADHHTPLSTASSGRESSFAYESIYPKSLNEFYSVASEVESEEVESVVPLSNGTTTASSGDGDVTEGAISYELVYFHVDSADIPSPPFVSISNKECPDETLCIQDIYPDNKDRVYSPNSTLTDSEEEFVPRGAAFMGIEAMEPFAAVATTLSERILSPIQDVTARQVDCCLQEFIIANTPMRNSRYSFSTPCLDSFVSPTSISNEPVSLTCYEDVPPILLDTSNANGLIPRSSPEEARSSPQLDMVEIYMADSAEDFILLGMKDYEDERDIRNDRLRPSSCE